MEHSHVKFLPDSNAEHDKVSEIEVFSENYEIVSDNNVPRKPRKSILDDLRLFQDAIARKKFTRWIMLLGGIFILLSGILLIVTLNMSKEIDDKVRDSNVLLRQQTSNNVNTVIETANSTIS